MKYQNYNEQVAFMAASLIELADMSETELPELVQIVGAKAISELLAMDSLREDLIYEEMAEEICNCIDWEPMLTNPPREDAELDRLGCQIAKLVEDNVPADDAAECLFEVLCWDGLWAWLAVSNGRG